MATISFLSTPPVYIATLAITVSGPGIATPMVFNLTIDSATHIASGSITVPAGSNRHIVANAFDSLGVNTHRGDTTVTLVEGVNPPISFRMFSLTGSVSIQISFGSSLLTLTPGDTTVSVGDTVQFAFAGTDEYGQTVLSPTWGVTNPGVARYLGGGKVVALAGGGTTVAVNAGFATIARTITVISGGAPSLQTGTILFHSTRSGHLELFVVNPDGTGEAPLPTGLSNSAYGGWGPSHATVVFASGGFPSRGEIYVMNVDGSSRTQLTSNGCNNVNPRISPDGTKVAWAWQPGGCTSGNWDIFVMNIDGTGAIQLTTAIPEDNSPQWSADGSKIFFMSTRSGTCDIWVMNSDGSNQVQLTNMAGNEGTPRPSPDGTRLAFSSQASGNDEVYVINVDGTGLVRMTSDPGVDLPVGWSPDGNSLAFSSNRGGNFDIYVMPVAGGNATAITTNLGDDYGLDWR